MTDEVINFEKKRSEAIEQRRRDFERIMFHNFLGVFTVWDDEGSVTSIEIIDISDRGCLFQISYDDKNIGKLRRLEEANLRIYFTEKSYIPVTAQVKYRKKYLSEDGIHYMKFGCEFDKSGSSYEALDAFIKFIYKFAEHACVDRKTTKILHL